MLKLAGYCLDRVWQRTKIFPSPDTCKHQKGVGHYLAEAAGFQLKHTHKPQQHAGWRRCTPLQLARPLLKHNYHVCLAGPQVQLAALVITA